VESLRGLYVDGIQIVLDEFGRGFSSLARIERLSVTEVKIDKLFVDEVDRSGVDVGSVSAIICMAGIIGLFLVVEGVGRPG